MDIGAGTAMSTGVVYLRPLTVLYVRARGPYAVSARTAWDRLSTWAEERGFRRQVKSGFGLVRDNAKVKAPQECRYDACIEIPDGVVSDEAAGIAMQILPGGSYARHRHTGGLEKLSEAFRWLSHEWAPGRGLAVDASRPLIEIYLSDPKVGGPSPTRMDICIPVVSARASRAA